MAFTLRVTAVSPFPEEPTDLETYRPSLLVAAEPGADDPALTPAQLAIGALLFVEWARGQLGDEVLSVRLQAILAQLRPRVRHGQIGPGSYAAHRARQRENYFHHRDAATYTVALHRDEAGLYAAIERRVLKGRWDEDSTLLEAATLAPYEALLRLAPDDGLILLDWLDLALDRWLPGGEAAFPVSSWSLDEPLVGP